MIEDGFDPDDPSAGLRERVPIATLRRRTGMSQDSFAAALHIPVKTLRNWEQGRTEPDPVVRSFFALVAEDPQRAFAILGDRVGARRGASARAGREAAPGHASAEGR